MIDLILSLHLLASANYSDLDPAFLGNFPGSVCRLCDTDPQDIKQSYRQLASASGAFSTLSTDADISLVQVCYNATMDSHIMYTPWATGNIRHYGFFSFLYTFPYINGSWVLSRPPSSVNMAEWDYLGDCLPSKNYESTFIKNTASARCGNHLPNDFFHCRQDVLPVDIFTSPLRSHSRTSRTHTIWASDSKGFMRYEVYMASASGSSPPVPVPTPRPPQDKNTWECVKSKFMDKFPFDFFALPNSGSPGCIRTNFLGHPEELCNEMRPIWNMLRISGAIAFAIAFYLYL